MLDAGRVRAMLEQAMGWVRHTTVFWHEFEAQMMRPLEPNTFGDVFTTPAGGADIFYGNGRIALAPDEALIVEVDEPEARYWSLQLYNEGWYESLDFGTRCTNRNNTQIHVDADGIARFVISEVDPGAPNWLDLAGHVSVFAHFRAVWCAKATRPRTSQVALADVRAALGPGHPFVDAAARRSELESRRAQVGWRHRR